ncbi:MAG: V-type proton ATPase subunit A [Amphiamblys sp. WSBS2006]|nr:MAG: V-type proton ATPase subunit A [Amphiamblys sp. WSBS2006]
MKYFLPEKMSLLQLYIPADAAHLAVHHLGLLGIVEFRDLNEGVHAFARRYTNEVKRMDELQKKINLLAEQTRRILPVPIKELHELQTIAKKFFKSNEIDEMERDVCAQTRRIDELNKNLSKLVETFQTFIEHEKVYKKILPILAGHNMETRTPVVGGGFTDIPDLTGETDQTLRFITGLVSCEKVPVFETILWRVLRGNVYISFTETDIKGLDETARTFFLVIYHGTETETKVKRIASSLGAALYEVELDTHRQEKEIERLAQGVSDLTAVIQNTQNTRRMDLLGIVDKLDAWAVAVAKEKEIYAAMNLFDYDKNRKSLIAEAWCPASEKHRIEETFRRIERKTGACLSGAVNTLPAAHTPPTYIPRTAASSAVQEMIDLYSVGSYTEFNAAAFSLATVPFLFGLMFGDSGHALFLILGSCYFILRAKKFEGRRLDEMTGALFTGRHLLLMAGVWSFLAGLIYNDFFSRSLRLFPSQFLFRLDKDSKKTIERRPGGYVYPFGLDWGWSLTKAKMDQTNSYKMKLSLLLAYCHITFGQSIHLANTIRRERYEELFLVALPRMALFSSVVGYICFLVVFKWLAGIDISILTTLIEMFFTPGKPPENLFFSCQHTVQKTLLAVAGACALLIFVGTPVAIYSRAEQPKTKELEEESGLFKTKETLSEETKEKAELVVYHVIHTIEFMLSIISNATSYLRLWAISLAHTQLSEIAWDLMESTVASYFFVPFLMFIPWALITVFFLVAIEGMSALLHALRLHWVEFNGAFYEGGGHRWAPFRFF